MKNRKPKKPAARILELFAKVPSHAQGPLIAALKAQMDVASAEQEVAKYEAVLSP